MFPRPRSIIKFPDSARNRNPEEYKGTVFYRTFVLLAPFYNSGTRCITIQLGVRIPFATPIAPKVETWGPAPPSGLLGTGRTRFRRASEHLSTSDSRCDPQKASNKNETNFMWYMDVVRVPLKRGQSWSCVPVNCLLVGILFPGYVRASHFFMRGQTLSPLDLLIQENTNQFRPV